MKKINASLFCLIGVFLLFACNELSQTALRSNTALPEISNVPSPSKTETSQIIANATAIPPSSSFTPTSTATPYVTRQPACFLAGTKIDTPNGEKLIEELQKGASIFAVDPLSGKRVATIVNQVFVSKQDRYLIIHTEDGGIVRTTAYHPFYNGLINIFMRIENFSIGDKLVRVISGNRSLVSIEDIEVINKTVIVYNLSVEHDYHTFLAGNYIVHNKTPTPTPGPPTVTPISFPINNCPPDCSEIDLKHTNLQQANLSGADFSEANLEGANLQQANLSGANFSGANLEGANLDRHNLSGVNLRGANLRKARLRDADLNGTDLRGVDLRQVDFWGANLRGSKIDDTTQLEAKWRLVWEIVNNGAVGRDLRRADLSWANLYQADFRGANLEGANLTFTELLEADFRGANLREANLNRVDLEKTNLKEADLQGTFLSRTNLKKVDLTTTKLSEANLNGANLEEANLNGVDLHDTWFGHANLKGSDLRNTIGFSEDSLRRATYNQATKWPLNFDPEQADVIFEE